jgi:hypothetical protein
MSLLRQPPLNIFRHARLRIDIIAGIAAFDDTPLLMSPRLSDAADASAAERFTPFRLHYDCRHYRLFTPPLILIAISQILIIAFASCEPRHI